MRLTTTLIAALMLALPAIAGAADMANPFAAAITVNGRSITNYQIDQREKFLSALEGPGDHRKEAEKALIDDQLRLFEAAKYGIKVTDAEIKSGIDEFAARGKMTADQFTAELQKAGIDPQTLRNFVAAGQAWRAVVQGTIAPLVTVTDADAKEARALSLAHGSPRLLLSELVMPATPEYADRTIPLIEQLSQTLHGDAAFEAAARQYSASDTAQKGGRLDWIPASQLPPAVVRAVVDLSIGEVSKPVVLPNAIGIFEMRGLADAPLPPSGQVQVDYAEYLIPGVHTPAVAAEAARIRASVRTCNDLYGIAKGQPAQVLTRVTRPQPQIPADVALALAPLDPGEASTSLTRGPNTVFLMLCSRTVTETPEPTLEEQKNTLFAARVNALADQKLDQLRAAAIILRP